MHVVHETCDGALEWLAKDKDNMNVRRVVIVGTSHSYQIPPIGPAANELIVNTHLVRAIAEEMSQEALANWDVTSSLCLELAIATGVSHRYCDLDGGQRSAAGVRHVHHIKADGFIYGWSPEKIEQEIRASHSIKERHWLSELLDLNTWPVLFICGAEHVLRFQQLLQENGLSAEVEAHDWAPNAYIEKLHGVTY